MSTHTNIQGSSQSQLNRPEYEVFVKYLNMMLYVTMIHKCCEQVKENVFLKNSD